MVRDHFGDMESLKDSSRLDFPKHFEEVIDPSNFSREVHLELKAKVAKHKRFVITTAVAGAPIHDDFFLSLKKYCEIKKAMLLVIPANYALYDIDPQLISDSNTNIVFEPIRINSNLSIDPIKIDPKQVDPAVGLDAIGRREGTVIIGSPKQRRIPIANSNEKLARIIQATGAMTKPRYVPADGVPKRRDRLAFEHHVIGAVVVEVVDDNLYHFRVVQAKRDGSFNDLFNNYSEDGEQFVGCEAIVQGDYHVGETDPQVDAAVDEMCGLGKPKFRIFHDFFSGISINHHEMKNKVLRAIQAGENKTSLEDELKLALSVIESKRKLKTAKHLVFVKSNHDEFLDRYLAEGTFDDQNRKISTKLQGIAMDKLDPFRYGLEQLMGLKDGPDLIWMKRDKDLRIAGIELGAHGDLGANGKRNPGSKGMYKAYGKVMYGHCHYGEIWHDSMSVGTSSYMRLGYNRGASSWDHSQGIVYKDGTRQLVNVINGKWRLGG